MQILYLDSLEHGEEVPSAEEYPIRAEAWTDKLIQAVMRKDSKCNGEFGKLRVSVCTSFLFFFAAVFYECVFEHSLICYFSNSSSKVLVQR
jgi:hypothetical protein